MGATIAHWISSAYHCDSGFKSQGHHPCFIDKFCTIFVIILRKGRKIVKSGRFLANIVKNNFRNDKNCPRAFIDDRFTACDGL